MNYEIIMKPTALSRKEGKLNIREYVVSVEADDTNSAAITARSCAAREGFAGYAITKIKELSKAA